MVPITATERIPAVWDHTVLHLPANTSPQANSRILDLPTQEGWKAELT